MRCAAILVQYGLPHVPRPIPPRLSPMHGPQTHLLGESVFVPLNYSTVKHVWGNDEDFMFYVSSGLGK